MIAAEGDPRAQVVQAARSRAAALAAGDATRLGELLHADFRWTSHTGQSFDRSSYIEANTAGVTSWLHQDLGDPEVVVVGDAAVLCTVVTDVLDGGDGSETYRMPMTQFWIRTRLGWRCLAGHAGPAPDSVSDDRQNALADRCPGGRRTPWAPVRCPPGPP